MLGILNQQGPCQIAVWHCHAHAMAFRSLCTKLLDGRASFNLAASELNLQSCTAGGAAAPEVRRLKKGCEN